MSTTVTTETPTQKTADEWAGITELNDEDADAFEFLPTYLSNLVEQVAASRQIKQNTLAAGLIAGELRRHAPARFVPLLEGQMRMAGLPVEPLPPQHQGT